MADHLSALPRIRHLIHISRLTPAAYRLPGQTGPDRTPTARPPSRQGTTVRISPSDVLFVILSTFTVLAAALVIGGLAARPFSV